MDFGDILHTRNSQIVLVLSKFINKLWLCTIGYKVHQQFVARASFSCYYTAVNSSIIRNSYI